MPRQRRMWVPTALGAVTVAVAATLLVGAGCSDDDGDGGAAGHGDGDVSAEASTDYIRTELPATIGEVLYAYEDARLALVTGAAAEEPELVDEILADGEITYEEFVRVGDVRDAMNGATSDFLAGYADEVAPGD